MSRSPARKSPPDQWRFWAKLWLYDGPAGWHFVTLPEDISRALRFATEGRRGGFGSVKVRAKIGTTAWVTSVFPDAKRNTFLLPVKADVRRREKLAVGDEVEVAIEIGAVLHR